MDHSEGSKNVTDKQTDRQMEEMKTENTFRNSKSSGYWSDSKTTQSTTRSLVSN